MRETAKPVFSVGVAPAHLRRVLKANSDLPQGEGVGGSKWFTLEEVLKLRDHFASEGVSTKEYLPYRPKNLPAKVTAVATSKVALAKPVRPHIWQCKIELKGRAVDVNQARWLMDEIAKLVEKI